MVLSRIYLLSCWLKDILLRLTSLIAAMIDIFYKKSIFSKINVLLVDFGCLVLINLAVIAQNPRFLILILFSFLKSYQRKLFQNNLWRLAFTVFQESSRTFSIFTVSNRARLLRFS